MVNSSNIIPPPSLSEIILKTSNFDVMKDWYKIALDMEPFFTRGRPEEVSWTKSQQIVFFKLYGLYRKMKVLFSFASVSNYQAPSVVSIDHLPPKH